MKLLKTLLLSSVLMFGLFGSVGVGYTENEIVQDGKTVKFDYSLKIEGQVVESSEGKEPLEYVHGQGQIIPGLSSELEGLKVGESKTVTVTPENAYGQVNPEAFREFPIDQFPEDFEPKEGMIIELGAPEGDRFPGIVWEIKEETVVLNFNHPLAGKTLEFDVKIVEISS